MDARDYKGKIDFPKDRHYLKEMFSLQKNLLKGYIGIEGLPSYPVDINTKEGQILLKDFNARIVEELGEAMESYELIMASPELKMGLKDVKPHLSNFNEEIADAMHFMLELLIFSGITEYDLMDEATETENGDLDDFISKIIHKSIFPPSDHAIMNNDRVLRFDNEESISLLQGGRVWDQSVEIQMKVILWDITFKLQMARNTLKNKPWKQTGVLTDEVAYRKYLIESFELLILFYVHQGVKPIQIFENYALKNQVNLFRQLSKY